MKKIASVIGILIFINFSALLLLEYGGIPMRDTVLFKLGGQSVGLQSVDVIDLSPILVGIFYWAMFALILFSIKLKKFCITLYSVNTIFAILLLLFYKDFLPYCPPFGTLGDDMGGFPTFIWASYAAIAFTVLFGIYFLLKRNLSVKSKKMEA